MSKIVNCPHCGAPVEWKAESKWRPFCSERCRIIDLGAWANEDYTIPSREPAPMEEHIQDIKDTSSH